jgi:D-alanine-D-alanine ligase
MSTRVAVLCGGRSSEHEVSIESARSVRGALEGEGLEVVPILITKDGTWLLDDESTALVPGGIGSGRLRCQSGRTEDIDVVFPVLHGPYGEDGVIQGLCEAAGVPFVGAGVSASAIAMDKVLFKMLLRDADIPSADFVALTAAGYRSDPSAVAREVSRLEFPLFCKPARLGSSVGISRVAAPDDLATAIELALVHDSKVLIEEGVFGRELEVGILGNDDDLVVSPPGEIHYDADWYDYETKYTPGLARVEIPAVVEPEVDANLRSLAARAYVALECAGMGRIDFFVRPDGSALMSELNTIPGFTQTSAYPSLMAAEGVQYGELVRRLIELAQRRAAVVNALKC